VEIPDPVNSRPSPHPVLEPPNDAVMIDVGQPIPTHGVKKLASLTAALGQPRCNRICLGSYAIILGDSNYFWRRSVVHILTVSSPHREY
jgi:hypothetical protein